MKFKDLYHLFRDLSGEKTRLKKGREGQLKTSQKGEERELLKQISRDKRQLICLRNWSKYISENQKMFGQFQELDTLKVRILKDIRGLRGLEGLHTLFKIAEILHRPLEIPKDEVL